MPGRLDALDVLLRKCTPAGQYSLIESAWLKSIENPLVGSVGATTRNGTGPASPCPITPPTTPCEPRERSRQNQSCRNVQVNDEFAGIARCVSAIVQASGYSIVPSMLYRACRPDRKSVV